MSGFYDLLSAPQLRKALAALGYDEPTKVQGEAIPRALEGKNLLVSSKTGSGKTAAFLLPCIEGMLTLQPKNPMSTRMLILTPTRELARQIVKNAQELLKFSGMEVGMVCGGEALKYQKAMLRKNPEIIVGTPGRLAEHVAHNSTDFSGLEYLVLDEADRMLDMGLSDDVLKITATCDASRQTLLFSATLEQTGLRHLIKQVVLGDTEEVYVEDIPNAITQQMVLTDDGAHKEKLLLALLRKSTFDKAIIFANTKVKVAGLETVLRRGDFRTGALHGDITQDERRKVLDAFRQGKTRVLVATDVAARGLDISGVDLVINLDVPYSGDEYVHRIGRTGRADAEGRAVTFVAASDWNLVKGIERYLNIQLEQISVPGVEAKYKGPDKLKKSGKAAGIKKVSDKSNKSSAKAKSSTEKVKVRERDKKNVGKRRQPKLADDSVAQVDGFAPLKKKPKTGLLDESEG